MCQCTPNIRTPFCGKYGCQVPFGKTYVPETGSSNGSCKNDMVKIPTINDIPGKPILGHISTTANQGWECPRCHSVYSPSYPRCDNCYKPDMRGRAL